MRILIALTYYSPYTSGVSEFARLLAEHLATRHEVTVLATQHESSLPREEVIRRVRVIRSPVAVRLHKGVLSPRYLLDFKRLAPAADVVNLHLPMFEAGLLALLCDRKRLVTMYQCDLAITGGLIDRLAVMVTRASARIALARAERITVTTLDYAKSSPIAAPNLQKLVEVRAPVKRPPRRPEASSSLGERTRIGFVGRFVEEKGIGVLLDAFAQLRINAHGVELVLVGQADGVAGGSVMNAIGNKVESLGDAVTVTGRVSEEELWRLYASFDILVLPSVNRYEAFGMVQVEAMLSGALVVASDLPGVRTIIEKTGCGVIAKVGSSEDLARALAEAIALRRRVSRTEVIERAMAEYPETASLELQEALFLSIAQSALKN